MNFQICKKNNNHGLAIACTTIILIVFIAGCHTTSYHTKHKKKQETRILEPRRNIPQPYLDPSPPSEPNIKSSKLSKKSTHGSRSHTKISQGGWTATKTVPVQPIPIKKTILPVETPPVVINEPLPKPVYDEPEPLPKISDTNQLSYSIKKGDTLWDIAKLYGVSVKELASENDMKTTEVLRVGRVLTIPPGGQYKPPQKRLAFSDIKPDEKTKNSPKKIRKRPIPASGKYIVKKGDNLWEIGQTFGLNLKKLKKLNELDSDLLHPGQVLVLVESESKSQKNKLEAPPVKKIQKDNVETVLENEVDSGITGSTEVDLTINIPDTNRKKSGSKKNNTNLSAVSSSVDLKNLPHYISAGDTLESIAEMYGSEVKWIREANPKIKGNSDLVEGNEIQVPCPDIK